MNFQHPDIVVRHIKTKNKMRKIVSYRSDDCELRKKHERIFAFIDERFIPSIFSKGYVKGRSIYHNALSHMYNDYFVMLDIKDFFPHICHKQLSEKIFYELNKNVPNQISKIESIEIVKSCSVNTRGIPLGFITSPILSNIYLKEFDGIFYGKLKELNQDNIIYTRYADDLTISFKTSNREKMAEIELSIVTIAANILSRYGLQLNNRKTRSYNLNRSNHVKITGVNISKDASGKRRLTVGRSIKNELYWNAIHCYETKDIDQIQQLKGIQSFILSVEKCGYESCFSDAMLEKIHSLGFSSLKQLIDSL